jgi:hypothetical protein
MAKTANMPHTFTSEPPPTQPGRCTGGSGCLRKITAATAALRRSAREGNAPPHTTQAMPSCNQATLPSSAAADRRHGFARAHGVLPSRCIGDRQQRRSSTARASPTAPPQTPPQSPRAEGVLRTESAGRRGRRGRGRCGSHVSSAGPRLLVTRCVRGPRRGHAVRRGGPRPHAPRDAPSAPPPPPCPCAGRPS